MNFMKKNKFSLNRKTVSLAVMVLLLVNFVLIAIMLIESLSLEKSLKQVEEMPKGVFEVNLELSKANEDLTSEIYEKNEIINEYRDMIDSYEQTGSVEEAPAPEPEKNIYMSQDYVSAKLDWNLVKNVEVKDRITPKIEVDSDFYYLLYSKGAASVSYFDKDKELLTTSEEKEMSGGLYLKLPEKCRYVSLDYTKDDLIFVSTGINVETKDLPERNKYFYVVTTNSPAGETLHYCTSSVRGGGTVLILPGTYVDTVSAQNKRLNLLGIDQNLCSIISYDSDYFNPPVEIAAGRVANLTIRAIDDGRHTSELKAYAIHSDFDYLCDKTLVIENCTLSSDYNASLGIGLRRATLTIQNCVFDDIFFHDYWGGEFGGLQYLVMKNNAFKKMTINSQEIEGADVNLTFINNTLSELEGFNIVTGQNFDGCFLGLNNFHLSTDSYGNSLSELNAQ